MSKGGENTKNVIKMLKSKQMFTLKFRETLGIIRVLKNFIIFFKIRKKQYMIIMGIKSVILF